MMLGLAVEEYPMTRTLALLLSASLAACAGEAAVHYSGDSNTPEMVAIDNDPSVMVVANADEPIFYTENSYYLYRNDHWYRSSSHRGGWARVETVPDHVRRIEQPRAYVHYRHDANAPRTTFNQRDRDQVAPQRPNDRDLPAAPPQEPNPQGPAQPYANPLPPQQVPPSPDSGPVLDGPRDPRNPQQVPPVNPDRGDRPNRQIAPDPDRAPTSPGMENRSRDQRPADDKSPDGKN
jgi:hypothetical protein